MGPHIAFTYNISSSFKFSGLTNTFNARFLIASSIPTKFILSSKALVISNLIWVTKASICLSVSSLIASK